MDHLAARWRLGPFRRGERARVATGTVHGRDVRLIKPQTYMNRSGAALAPLLATDLGRFRLRGAGSSGGHNGLKSIEGTLRRQDYSRLRIGIGPVPPGLNDLADFVLGAFTREERDVINDLLDPMADAVEG